MQDAPAIDAVITWVDGQDTEHEKKRLSALASRDINSNWAPAGTTTTRFQDSGEIYYCIASLLKFAPFIRRIFIVTDNQTPQFLSSFAEFGLCDPSKISVIDHSEIFRGYEDALPIFNSRAIETMIWRIKDLAEYFVFLNDDFFLSADASLGDFLDAGGNPVIRGEVHSVSPSQPGFSIKSLFKKKVQNDHGLSQINAALLLGKDNYLKVPHRPHVLRKSTLAKYFDENPSVLPNQLAHKFRSPKQFHAISLANLLEINNFGARPLPPIEGAYLKPKTVNAAKLRAIPSGRLPHGCIQSLEEFVPAWRLRVHLTMCEMLDKYLPSPIANYQKQRATER